MDGETIGLLTLGWGTIFFIIQRTETKKRRGVALVMSVIGVIMLWYIGSRQVWGEGVTGFFIALLLNALFWLFIGRYNPVGSSDDIHVLGMDD